jgi:hypothetical protein
VQPSTSSASDMTGREHQLISMPAPTDRSSNRYPVSAPFDAVWSGSWGSDAQPIDRLTTAMNGRHARRRVSQHTGCEWCMSCSSHWTFDTYFDFEKQARQAAGQEIERCKNKRKSLHRPQAPACNHNSFVLRHATL